MVFCNRGVEDSQRGQADVTILILVDGFLQFKMEHPKYVNNDVTILILVDGFLQYMNINTLYQILSVTILILVDGFLQSKLKQCISIVLMCHNPYFSRWFSAMKKQNPQ